MEVVWMPGRVRTEIHVGGEETDGAFCMLVDETPVGWSLPLHRHAAAAETIHVLEGEFEMEVDGTTCALPAGATIHIPQGVPHAGANVGDGPGRRVIVFSPAGMEAFFREAGAATPDETPDLASLLSVAGRHGWRFG